MKDYYEILQVSPNAEPEVIAAAYRRLARKYHPDAYAAADATDRMKELNEAYEVLGDPPRRAEYDRIRSYARAGVRRAEREDPKPPPREEPAEPPKAARTVTLEPSTLRAAPVVFGLLGLGVAIGIGVWVAVGAANKDEETSLGGATGGLPGTSTPGAGSLGFSSLSATPRRAAVATLAPTRSEPEGVGLAHVWRGSGTAPSCWDVGPEDQTQCIVEGAEASGASKEAIAFFLEHGYFLDSFQESGRVDWGLVWHPIGDQTRRHPAFLNGTPAVLVLDDALGSMDDLADDATTYWGELGKLVVWPQYATLQSVQSGAVSTTWAGDVLGQAFVFSIPLKECRACPTERELEVGFIFDEAGGYRGRGLWHQ